MKELLDRGCKVYLVGGAVRDTMLQLPVHDHDYVVTGATPELMIELGFKQVGASFPVFLHPDTGDEYALARTETKTGKGYLGFETSFDPSTSIEDDLYRRDLTINAMAIDVVTGKLIDPYGGMADLEQRRLRHCSLAFAEDPLRVFRVARFAARFAFSVTVETMQLMSQIVEAGELEHISRDRIWKEMEKGLLEAEPDRMFYALSSCGALKKLGPWGSVTTGDVVDLSRVARYTTELVPRFITVARGFTSKQLYEAWRIPASLRKLNENFTMCVDLAMHQFSKLFEDQQIKILIGSKIRESDIMLELFELIYWSLDLTLLRYAGEEVKKLDLEAITTKGKTGIEKRDLVREAYRDALRIAKLKYTQTHP